MRYLIKVAYDGAPYRGWQRQVGVPTVAETIETALSKILAHPVTVVGAGRTDRGVHATGQYAHWDTEKPLPSHFWLASMPYYLKAFKSFLFFGWRIRFMRGIWRLRAITGTF
jgi:tRNA pseudouridine38-40 synthase